jgi:hypothetical protein
MENVGKSTPVVAANNSFPPRMREEKALRNHLFSGTGGCTVKYRIIESNSCNTTVTVIVSLDKPPF